MSVFGFLDNDCSNITQAATVHSECPSAYRGTSSIRIRSWREKKGPCLNSKVLNIGR